MTGSDVDRLLEGYLDKETPDPLTEGQGPKLTSPRRPTTTGRNKPVGRLTDELESLLDRYLETRQVSDVSGQQDTRFALPRKAEIDALLQRYDSSDNTAVAVLEDRLREHVAAVDSTRRAVGSTLDLDVNVGEHQWVRKKASDLQGVVNVSERLHVYVEGADDVIDYDEEDEELYTFEPEVATIQGVPLRPSPSGKGKEDAEKEDAEKGD